MEQSIQKVRSRHEGLSGATLMLLLVPWLLLAPHLTAQDARERVHGAKVHLLQNEGADLRGELLALHDARVWVLSDRGVIEQAPLALVREVRIQRHDWPARRIVIWTGVAGGLTSAGMFSACVSQSETGDCVLFALGWAGAWTGIGALSGLLVRPSERIRPGRFGELRAYARFPQGPPEGYLPGTDADRRTFPPNQNPEQATFGTPVGRAIHNPFAGPPVDASWAGRIRR